MFGPCFVVSPKDMGSNILPKAFTLFPPNPISGNSEGCSRFVSMFILSKVLENRISAELPISMSILRMVHPWMFALMTRTSV